MSVTIFFPKEGNHLETTSMLICFPFLCSKGSPDETDPKDQIPYQANPPQFRPVLKEISKNDLQEGGEDHEAQESDEEGLFHPGQWSHRPAPIDSLFSSPSIIFQKKSHLVQDFLRESLSTDMTHCSIRKPLVFIDLVLRWR